MKKKFRAIKAKFSGLISRKSREKNKALKDHPNLDKDRLIKEFQVALDACSAKDLKNWGIGVAKILSLITIRRVEGLFLLLKSVSGFLLEESLELTRSILTGRFGDHIKERTDSSIAGAKKLKKELKETIQVLSEAFKNDPRSLSAKLFSFFLGFYTGSGGRDGGLPDLDFLLGIGAHRSILTHSILVGIIFEALLLSTLELALIVHEKLPEDHDPWWDDLKEKTDEITQAFISGVSSGIASHLAIDATIDGGGTYKDLPVPLPMIGHQTIMGVNAVTEMIDSFRKSLKDPLNLVCSSLEKDLEEKTSDNTQDANVTYVENKRITVHYQKGLYRGETLNDLPHGQGVFISRVKKKKEGKEAKYREAKLDGEFQEGIFLGKALIEYENGARYEGHIEGDLKCNGFGIIRYPLGAKYIGNIIDAKREGYGIYHEPEGTSKVGTWKSDKPKRVEDWIAGRKAA